MLTVYIAGGTGAVGTAVAAVLAKAGHKVFLGSRDPSSSKAVDAVKHAQELAGHRHAPNIHGDCATIPHDTDAIILAFPSQKDKATLLDQAESLKRMGDVKGRVVIDMTNPFAAAGGMLAPELSGSTSAAEEFAHALPGARVFKALNTIGTVHLGHPEFECRPARMLYAGGDGGDEAGKRIVETIITATGFVPTWAGPLRYARSLESMAMLWVGMAYITKASPSGDNNFAITLVTRD